MKKQLFTLALLLAVGTFTFAQGTKDSKGPATKNAKFWKKKKLALPIFTTSKKEQLTGPEAKNQNPATRDKNRSGKMVLVIDKQRSKQKGPAAKNYKIWKDYED